MNTFQNWKTGESSKRNAFERDSVDRAKPCIASYRLFHCPAQGCKNTISPSTVLPHFQSDHPLMMTADEVRSGKTVLIDVGEEMKKVSGSSKSNSGVRLVQIRWSKLEIFPLLVNVHFFSAEQQDEINKHNCRISGDWFCIWLSSISYFDNWFSVKLFNTSSPCPSVTKICKPVLMQHPMGPLHILDDDNVLMVEKDAIDSISGNEKRLTLEITMHKT